jgi:uncharacterized membrane protein
MSSRLDRTDTIALALLGGSATITAALYTRLPERLPYHFDVHGRPDAWVDKPVGAVLLLAIGLVGWALTRFGARLLPRDARARLERSPVGAAALSLVALFCLLHAVVLWTALRDATSAAAPLGIALAIFWIALAQILPRVRRNPILGIRTAWTLSSDENWARTHRFAGIAMTVGGLVALVASLLGGAVVAFTALVLSALAPVGYSFLLAHHLPPER